MDTLVRNIRYGIRSLLRRPGFTAVALATLALGIGANSTIFSIVNAVLLKPFPYQEPDRLVLIERQGTAASSKDIHSYPVYNNLRELGKSFEDVAAFRARILPLDGPDGPERVWGSRVSSNFFSVLGVTPILGRAFLPGEDQPKQPNIIVLSYGLWRRRFAADPKVIGRTLVADKESFQIVGVMPADFNFDPSSLGERSEYWTPLNPTAGVMKSWRVSEAHIIARLKPSTTLTQARAELSVDADRIKQKAQQESKGFDDRFGLSAITLREYFVGDTRKPLLILFGAVGFVLLIALVNVANLQMAHGVGRQKEIAIRSVLGASRGRLMGQLLTEGVMLSLAGGLLGLLFMMWSLRALGWLMPKGMVQVEALSIDRRVLFFTLTASLFTGILFGLLPSIRASKPEFNTILRLGMSPAASGGFRNLLVVAEVALALVLLVGSGLMANSFIHLIRVNSGLKTENVLSMQLQLLSRQTAPEQRAFAAELLPRIQALPGVKNVALINGLPISETGNSQSGKRSVMLQIPFAANPEEEIYLEPREATPGYFQTLGIRLLRGRLFTDADNAESQPVVVVSESLAQEAWAGEDPLGKKLRLGSTEKQWPTVIGVVSDVRHHQLNQAPTPLLYAPFSQNPDSFVALVVRTESDPAKLTSVIRKNVLATDGRVVINGVMTMDQRLSDLVAVPRFFSLLLGWFAVMGLMLSVIGLYGVISYAVSQRTREMGIRMALGAQQWEVLKLVVGHGLVLAVTGIVFGLAGAFVLSRLLISQLFGVTATDPATYLSVSVLLFSVALLACYFPARRATKVDPLIALRYE
jgi:putative ABC transport system permease protein